MSSSFYKVGGTLPTNSPSYVIRTADTELFNLLKQGEYCYVFNSRQMGKSSIKDQTQHKLKKKDFSVLILIYKVLELKLLSRNGIFHLFTIS